MTTQVGYPYRLQFTALFRRFVKFSQFKEAFSKGIKSLGRDVIEPVSDLGAPGGIWFLNKLGLKTFLLHRQIGCAVAVLCEKRQFDCF